jgi:hypothetical protein
MTRLESAILLSLREHPHHNTLPQLLAVLRGPDVSGDAVARALDRLKSEGLVLTDGPHWQLSAQGWRQQRRAA